MKKHVFTVIIERDEDGFYVGSIPALKGCYTQGETLDELMQNIKEVAELCLEVEENEYFQNDFVGVQQMELNLHA